MKALLLTFDVEEFDWPTEFGKELSPDVQIEATDQGLLQILPLLAARRVPATFFVTGAFAQAKPATVRAIVRAGHEAAVHGLRHGDDYSTMGTAAIVDRLREARALVEAAGGQAPAGVRLPRLRGCAPRTLRVAGFRYDATPHPTWMPGRYCGLRWPRRPWQEDGITRVPISVIPVVRLPVSWLWYRSCWAHAGQLAPRLALIGAPYLQLYFHPWEALRVDRFGIPSWLAARTGPEFVRTLDHLLGWSTRHLEPTTVSAFLGLNAGERASRVETVNPTDLRARHGKQKI